MACMWFGEICSCALNNSRNKFHQTTYKPYFRSLYSIHANKMNTRLKDLLAAWIPSTMEESVRNLQYSLFLLTPVQNIKSKKLSIDYMRQKWFSMSAEVKTPRAHKGIFGPAAGHIGDLQMGREKERWREIE